MNEGWVGDDYLILFDESEVATMTERYAFSQFPAGYQVFGLPGWDDFIVRDYIALLQTKVLRHRKVRRA